MHSGLPPGPWYPDEVRERLLVTLLSVTFLLLVGGEALASPDTWELLATARVLLGEPIGRDVTSADWPPLWPLLVHPLAGWLGAYQAGRLVNLLAAGLVAWPLHALGARAGGPWTARAAVVWWALLPAVREHAVVLDARPLGWLAFTVGVLLLTEAVGGRRPWWPVFLAAAVAMLVRPQGLGLLVLAFFGMILAKPRRAWRAPLLAAAALAPKILLGLRIPPQRMWPLYRIPDWSDGDWFSLAGPASAPTGFRLFLQDAVHAGIETPAGLVDTLWNHGFLGGFSASQAWSLFLGGEVALVQALPGLLGAVGCLLLLVGAVRFGRRGRHQAMGVVAAAGTLVVLAALPMTWTLGSSCTSLLFAVPALLVIASVGGCLDDPESRCGLGWRRYRWHGLLALALAEANLGPLQSLPPAYPFRSPTSLAASELLARDPPPSGRVYCTYGARSVVWEAGLLPVQLPSAWETWSPEPETAVLMSYENRQDGGRNLALLEDPAWRVAWTLEEPGSSMEWFIHLKRTPPPDF